VHAASRGSRLFHHDIILQALVQDRDIRAAGGERVRRQIMIKKHKASGMYDTEATSFLDGGC
jgi:hypothetical protein